VSKSSRALSTGRSWSRRSGTVTVIEAKVHRSSERNARLGFFVTLFIVGLVTATVAKDEIHPILALFVGVALGVIAGAIVWAIVRVWPVIRLIWWWTPEILIATVALWAWVQLAEHTPTVLTLLIATLAIGAPAIIPASRRFLVGWLWCFIVRHRLRVCFAQFIVANQSGSLPLILWAHPTPVGERVWVYLRPGLSKEDLEGRLDRIAVTCHASSVLVDRASDGTAAYLRFDIKRREVLTGTVGSPLADTDPAMSAPTLSVVTSPARVPTALDLSDISAPVTVPTAARSARAGNGAKPTPAPADAGGDDITDWI
jgi:hypothetical protein